MITNFFELQKVIMKFSEKLIKNLAWLYKSYIKGDVLSHLMNLKCVLILTFRPVWETLMLIS